MEWLCRHCQMAQLVGEEMKFELEWNSTTTTIRRSGTNSKKVLSSNQILAKRAPDSRFIVEANIKAL